MAKGRHGSRRLASHSRLTPHPLPCRNVVIQKKGSEIGRVSSGINKEWEDVTCPVCMEFPHNAFLLLCSSYNKGCRPYLCGTSRRYSNCFDRYKKTYTKVTTSSQDLSSMECPGWPLKEKSEVTELACPLCRGQVKGWTIVEPAREYLNSKKRSCMHDECSFVGSYRALRKHSRSDHRSMKPCQVDPALEQKWKHLENERERADVISTIRSSTPGAVVMGDYVIENAGGVHSDEQGERGLIYERLIDILSFIQTFENSGNASFASRLRRAREAYRHGRSNNSTVGDPVGANLEDAQDADETSSDTRQEIVAVGGNNPAPQHLNWSGPTRRTGRVRRGGML